MRTVKETAIENRIEELLGKMTLDEKISMIHGSGFFKSDGVKRLGIPDIFYSDGPMGIRRNFKNAEWVKLEENDDYVTYLPSNSALASTWNREQAGKMGDILGAEARARGKDISLAPGINIKRTPLCGRNFEYMSEDPKLIEELVVPFIKEVQKYDVASCVKHYAFNSQESERMSVDSVVDERAAREIYLPGFKAAVQKAGTYSIMSAYNRYKGIFCSHSKELLEDILREEWGFDGAVVSDWGAVHDTVAAAEVGLDVEMDVRPCFDDYFLANPLKKLVAEGKISEEYIDKKIRNILRLMFRINMLDGDRAEGSYNTREHQEAVLECAKESIILLKNDEDVLPLKKEKGKKIAIIGLNASVEHADGGGSAEINALYEICPLMGIRMQLGGSCDLRYAKGYDESGTDKLMPKALELAKASDEVIFVGGLNHKYDVEGWDRKDMKLPFNQDELISELLKINPNTVIVMEAGSPVDMSAWADKAKAIVWMYYSGMEGGKALAEILFGACNPSGKLAETFPVHLEDSPAHAIGEFPGKLEGEDKRVCYNESVYVGYRYYTSKKVKPMFCFGHGLSYTEFEYSDICAETEENNGLNLKVSVMIENTGKLAGKEVVQLYISPVDPTVERPVLELKAFDKIELKAGEKKKAEFVLDESAFAYWDTDRHTFVAPAGKYEILAGASSENILQKTVVELKNEYVVK